MAEARTCHAPTLMKCFTLLSMHMDFRTHPGSHIFAVGNFVALGLNHGSVDDVTLTKRAILVYAVFRTTNALRHGGIRNVEHATDMLQQFCNEAGRGHRHASKSLEQFLGAHRR